MSLLHAVLVLLARRPRCPSWYALMVARAHGEG